MALEVVSTFLSATVAAGRLTTAVPSLLRDPLDSPRARAALAERLDLPLVGLWVSLLRVPRPLLVTGILLMAVTGAFAVRNSLFDVWVMAGLGFLGYALRTLDFPIVPLVLGLVLGPFVEKYFRESLFLSRGDLGIFVGDPVSLAIWGGSALVLVLGAWGRRGAES